MNKNPKLVYIRRTCGVCPEISARHQEPPTAVAPAYSTRDAEQNSSWRLPSRSNAERENSKDLLPADVFGAYKWSEGESTKPEFGGMSHLGLILSRYAAQGNVRGRCTQAKLVLRRIPRTNAHRAMIGKMMELRADDNWKANLQSSKSGL